MPLEIADEKAFRIETVTPTDRHWNDNKGDLVVLSMNPAEHYVRSGEEGVRAIEERFANSHTGMTWSSKTLYRSSKTLYSMVKLVGVVVRFYLLNSARNRVIVRHADAPLQHAVMYIPTPGAAGWIMMQPYLTVALLLNATWSVHSLSPAGVINSLWCL